MAVKFLLKTSTANAVTASEIEDGTITGADLSSTINLPSGAQLNGTAFGGAATLNVGTGAGTVAAGNDSRITGALQAASNLSDLASASTARTNLGLGGAATLAVGTTADTVAAGNDSRITGAVQTSRTIAGLALSSDISASSLAGAIGLNSTRTLIGDTGWTNSTTGTASITRVSGTHTFNVNANAFAIERRATISTAECPAIEVMGRINVTTGTPATSWYSSISLANTADTYGFLAQVHENGKLGLYQTNGSGWTQVALSAGAFALGSGIWVRLVVTPSYASCGYLATGTNTPPAAGSEWNLGGTVATTIATLAQSYLNQVGVRAGRSNTGSGTYTTEWTQLQWRILGVAS